jgi:hypothetical protein
MGAVVCAPASLRWEVGNAVTAGVKRRRLTHERARQLVTDFEQVTIRELAIDLKRAVDLGLELRIYAYDAYILEAARSSGFPLLARVGRPDPEQREKAGLVVGGAGSMKRYTYSTARQHVAEVLEEASREGEVQIRRQDGRVSAVTPVATSVRSPFANITGRPVKGVTSKDLLRAVREVGWARGTRALRGASAGRVPRGKRRAR